MMTNIRVSPEKNDYTQSYLILAKIFNKCSVWNFISFQDVEVMGAVSHECICDMSW